MLKEKVNKLISKVLFLTAISLFTFHIISAQAQTGAYKFAEYESPQGGGCDEYFRMVDFVGKINQEGSKGVVVVYSGNNSERFGNLLAYSFWAKRYLTSRMGVPPEQISFVIAEGKNLFNEEFWIVPKDAKEPEFKLANLDWTKLENKYHFSQTCSTCEPSYPLLTSFQPNYEEYAKIIKENTKYKGLITVGSSRSSSQIRKILTKIYNLPRNRFAIRILKSKSDEETIVENLYIITKE